MELLLVLCVMLQLRKEKLASSAEVLPGVRQCVLCVIIHLGQEQDGHLHRPFIAI